MTVNKVMKRLFGTKGEKAIEWRTYTYFMTCTLYVKYYLNYLRSYPLFSLLSRHSSTITEKNPERH
jgi:hypothetical protein